MPQILEMKQEQDGDLWVRVARSALTPNGPISLYYQSEIDAVRRRAYEEAIRAITALLEGDRGE